MTTQLPAHWTLQPTCLTRDYQFKSFAAALGFMVQIALFCEKTDHHPDWTNVYNKLSVRLSTHDAGGVTAKDYALAQQMEQVFGDS